MKLLEEKGLREKIINECIKKENELNEWAEFQLSKANNSSILEEKMKYIYLAANANYAIKKIIELRMNLLMLLVSEKLFNECLQGSSEKEAKGILKDLLDNEKVE